MANELAVVRGEFLPVQVTKRANALALIHGLNANEERQVAVIIDEFRVKPATVGKLLERGLEVREISQVIELHRGVNGSLSGSHVEQQVSIEHLVQFRQQFRDFTDDPDAVRDFLVEVSERFRNSYVNHILGRMIVLSRTHQDLLPEALLDVMAGNSEFLATGEDGYD